MLPGLSVDPEHKPRTPDMDIHQASNLMVQQQIRRLPVVENRQIVGVVALGDLAVQN
ncbi:CBS domain-containing protein [Oceanobacillus sp. M65]|uniref:CBS domain-containing protein n=1 Tax=Oceanobacillus sp. M65 TaxID=3457435 RepID=UPI003FCE4BEF